MLGADLKRKLARDEVTVGAWLTLAHVSVAEILASLGLEWVVIDMEHTAIDLSEVLRLIPAVERAGIPALVRVPRNDAHILKSVMDQGAAGVIVPDVRDRAGAERAVAAVKYPPVGARGVGIARAHGYGPDFDGAFARANAESVVVLQIEHVDAVSALDGILGVAGVDATFIGPFDLSASLGVPGRLDHPNVLAASRRVVDASRARGVAPGIHLVRPAGIEGKLRAAVDDGYRFIALGTDALVLGDSYRAIAAAARAARPTGG